MFFSHCAALSRRRGCDEKCHPEVMAFIFEDEVIVRETSKGIAGRYVFSDKEEIHDGFFFKSLDGGWFEKVYEDDYCAVLRTRGERGVPAGPGT